MKRRVEVEGVLGVWGRPTVAVRYLILAEFTWCCFHSLHRCVTLFPCLSELRVREK